MKPKLSHAREEAILRRPLLEHGIRVEHVKARHFDALGDLELRCGESFANGVELMRMVTDCQWRALVATLDDEVAGWLAYQKTKHHWWLTWARVDPRVRRIGIFRALARVLTELCEPGVVYADVPESELVSQLALRDAGFIAQFTFPESVDADGTVLCEAVYSFEWARPTMYPATRNRIADYFQTPASRGRR